MILGHKRQLAYLNRALAGGRFPHAYIFYGPEHVGKLMIAKTLAKALHCSASGHSLDHVCNICKACQDIENNAHRNVILLSRERSLVSKKEERTEIPIEDIRELKRMFSFGAVGDAIRVVIIDGADAMSEEASNAFLKLLEEPGAQSLFILIAESRESLIPTIVSRGQPIGFSLVSERELVEYTSTSIKDEKGKEAMVEIAMGRPGILIRMMHEKGFSEDFEKRTGHLKKIFVTNDLPEAFRFNEHAAYDITQRKEAEALIFYQLRNRMLRHASGADVSSAIESLKTVQRVSTLLDTTNVNPRLGMDMMSIEVCKNSLS